MGDVTNLRHFAFTEGYMEGCCTDPQVHSSPQRQATLFKVVIRYLSVCTIELHRCHESMCCLDYYVLITMHNFPCLLFPSYQAEAIQTLCILAWFKHGYLYYMSALWRGGFSSNYPTANLTVIQFLRWRVLKNQNNRSWLWSVHSEFASWWVTRWSSLSF